MKIYREKPTEFEPIVIKLETRAEAWDVHEVLAPALDYDSGRTHIVNTTAKALAKFLKDTL